MKFCSTLFALLLAESRLLPQSNAFVPSALLKSPKSSIKHASASKTISPRPVSLAIRRQNSSVRTTTNLRMAAEDFNEAKYTEAAWSIVASLTKVADYYSATSVEAPFVLDVMLNPTKHSAGEDAEAAKKVVEKILTKAGANVKDLRSELEKYLSKQPRVSDSSQQKVMGRNLQQVLETARKGKEILSDSFVSTEGLVLALVKEDGQFTRDALMKQGVKYQDVLDAVKEMREKTGPAISRSAENMYDALMKYGIDFTEKAAEGKLDPVIGRDDEIRRAIQILSRRTKNNPVLIGDPGVGKVRGSRSLVVH